MSTDAQGVRTGTGWAWAIALLPLLQVAAIQLVLAGLARGVTSPDGRLPDDGVGLAQAGFVANLGATVLVIGLSGLFARFDHRVLLVRVARPFPWAWGFLLGVYLVGRTVVLHRRVGRGAGPLVVFAAVLAGSTLLGFAEIVVLLGEVLRARG